MPWQIRRCWPIESDDPTQLTLLLDEVYDGSGSDSEVIGMKVRYRCLLKPA